MPDPICPDPKNFWNPFVHPDEPNLSLDFVKITHIRLPRFKTSPPGTRQEDTRYFLT